MVTPEIHVAGDPEAVARAAGQAVLELIAGAVAGRGRAFLSLAGGTTPEPLYRVLAAAGRAAAPWDRVDWLFGDERCVEPSSPDSNYGSAKRTLLDPLGVAADRVHRIEGERRPPARAAELYEERLRAVFGSSDPGFDIALLGIGPDGHTASLFPGSGALDETRRWVVAVRAPEGYEPAERITVTLPVLNGAGAVVFLATGANKAAAVAAVVGGTPEGLHLPAARVRPRSGRLLWFLDEAAAGSRGAQ